MKSADNLFDKHPIRHTVYTQNLDLNSGLCLGNALP